MEAVAAHTSSLARYLHSRLSSLRHGNGDAVLRFFGCWDGSKYGATARGTAVRLVAGGGGATAEASSAVSAVRCGAVRCELVGRDCHDHVLALGGIGHNTCTLRIYDTLCLKCNKSSGCGFTTTVSTVPLVVYAPLKPEACAPV